MLLLWLAGKKMHAYFVRFAGIWLCGVLFAVSSDGMQEGDG